MGDRELEQLRHPACRMDHPPVGIGMTSVPPPVVARLWDSNHDLRYTIDTVPSDHVPEQRILTLPLDHPAAQWLINDVPDQGCPSLTIDGENGRWCGPLDHFKVGKVGSCPQCDHCQQKIVRSMWRDFRRA
jgi:hypothetical protein